MCVCTACTCAKLLEYTHAKTLCSTPSNAFYGDSRPYLSYPTLEDACESTSDTNLCGSYASMGSLSGDDACEVLLNPFTNDFVGTARVNYTYRGPVAAAPNLGQYGVYTRNVQYYSDT